MNKISSIWLSKQMEKNKSKKVQNDTQNKLINTKEKKKMDKRKKIVVAVDAGKGYTKWFYVIKREDGTLEEVKGIERSSVEIGKEASMGGTVYIDDKPHNFTSVTKVVEIADKSKNNEAHRALMQNILFKIAIEEDVTDFDVIMCTSLDQFKVKENVEAMRDFMNVGKFNARKTIRDKATKEEVDVDLDITIHNVVIEPETLVSTRFAKTKLKKCYSVLVDIGTLNVGVVPLVEGRLDLDTVIAPRIGYQYMLECFKKYIDSNTQTEYSVKQLEIFIEKHLGSDNEKYKEMNDNFIQFFETEYSKLLKKEIDKAEFGNMACLIFVGGTSIRCKELIEKNFKEYDSVEIIKDIHATVKGAYKKGLRDLEKLNQEAQLQK